MKFPKEFLQGLVYEEEAKFNGKIATIIDDKICNNSRWSIQHEAHFEYDGKFYATYYNVGATEMQDEAPYEDDNSEIECDEVRQVEKLVKVWEFVK